MDDAFYKKINDLLESCLSQCSNNDAAIKCQEIKSFLILAYDKTLSLKINDFLLFENNPDEDLHICYVFNDEDYFVNHRDYIINSIITMEKISIIIRLHLKTNEEFVDLKIVLPQDYPKQIPLINLVRADTFSKDRKKQFEKELLSFFKNAPIPGNALFDFLFDLLNRLKNNTEINNANKKDESPLNLLKMKKSQSIFIEDERKFKMEKVITNDIKNINYDTPSFIDQYKFRHWHDWNLSLFQPKKKSFHYRYGPVNFKSHKMDYKAFDLNKKKLYRLTFFDFDLCPIKNTFPVYFEQINERIEKLLLEHLNLKRYVCENYKDFNVTKIDIGIFRITILKKDFEEKIEDFYTFKNFIEILSTVTQDERNLHDQKHILYLISMLKHLSFLHDNRIFHGHFDVKKILLSKNGEVLMYDSYYETLFNDIVPLMIKHSVDIVSDNEIKFNSEKLENFDFHTELMQDEVVNFGLFTFFLFANNYDSSKLSFFDCSESQELERFKYISQKLNSIADMDLRELIKSCIPIVRSHRVTIKELLSKKDLLEAKITSNLPNSKTKNADYLKTIDPKYSPRLKNEFVVYSTLGSGGYGSVIKVRRPIDNSFYAVKLCPVKPRKLDKIMSETICLSRLNHPNIVRYYSCWFEDRTDVGNYLRSSRDEESSSTNDISNSIQFMKIGANNSFILDKHVFCIQMELCDNPTLYHYLANNGSNGISLPAPKQKILSEIVSGLAYIHKQAIIHRDLKPPNIFFDSNFCVKIGDFGLSHFLEDIQDSEEFKEKKDQFLTQDLGTPMYSAPELHKRTYFNSKYKIKGLDNGKPYTSKVDIYSLGIIYFELCYPFKTLMERAIVIGELRQVIPTFPSKISDFINEEEMNLIQKLISFNPDDRPTAYDLEYILKTSQQSNKEKLIGMDEIKRIISIPSLFNNLLDSIFKLDSPLSKKTINSLYDSLIHDMHISVDKKDEKNIYLEKLEKINLTKNYTKMIAGLYSAADFPIPTLIPKNLLKSDNNSIDMRTQFNWYLMDRNGIVVSLPLTNRVQLAKHVVNANEQIVFLRRSSIDKCFIQVMNPIGIQELHEINFDMIWPEDWSRNTSPILPYCELIGFAYQFLSYFVPNKRIHQNSLKNDSEITFYMTNVTILSNIIEFFNLPPVILEKLIQFLANNDYKLLNNCDYQFWIDAKCKFIEIDATKQQTLFEFIQITECSIKNFKESILRVLAKSSKKSKSVVNKFYKTKILPLIEEMENISVIFSRTYYEFGAKNNISANFKYSLGFISKNSFFYDKLIINIIVPKNGKPYIIGHGGKYRNLISSFENENDSIVKKNGIGISFDVQDLCDFIDTNIRESVVYNEEFISCCQKFFQNMSNLFFSPTDMNSLTSTSLSTSDVLIYCAIELNSNDDDTLFKVCHLANQLRKKGLRVALLPEVTSEEFIDFYDVDSIETNAHLSSFLNKMNTKLIVTFNSFHTSYHCYYRSFSSESSSGFEWKLHKCQLWGSILSFVNNKMNEEFHKISDAGDSSEDSSQTLETCLPFHLEIEIFYGDNKRIKHHKKEIINEIKKITIFNFNNFTADTFKVMAFDLPINRIRTITETIQISKIQSINQNPKEKFIKLQSLIQNFTETVCSKNREIFSHVEKCVREICNYFAARHSKQCVLIIFSISSNDAYQYRIMFN